MRSSALPLLAVIAWALPATGAETEIEALVEQMGGQDVSLRYAAYQALCARRDPATVAPLLERIASWDVSAQSYGTSVLQMLPAERAAPAWRKLLSSSSPYLRLCAAWQFRDSEPERASKVGVEAIAAAEKDVAALPLMFSRVSGWKDPAVLGCVRTFVRPDAQPVLLAAALDCLDLAKDGAAFPAARRVARNPESKNRFLAAAWLAKLGEEEFAQALADGLRAGQVSYSDFNRVRWWLESADRLPPVVLDAAAARAEAETDTSYVISLLYLLGKRRHGAAAPLLRRLLDSDDAAVSKAAFEALVQLPGSFGDEALRRQLESPDPSRRLATAEALRRADDLSGLPTVIELAKAGSPVRADAARILGGFRVDAAVEPLIDALTDESSLTRSYAGTSLSAVLQTLFPYRRIDLASLGVGTGGATATRRDLEAAAERLRAWWRANKDKPW
jgi:HEAT repeat protein